MEMAWYNFQTQNYEYADVPTTDEDACKYIPPKGVQLYKLYRLRGDEIMDAMIQVLLFMVGANDND